jgi:formamidopyrimidine-DNA glycosylase
MLEVPESSTIAKQLGETVRGKAIRRAVANASPHKFAFYQGDPADYGPLLAGQVIGACAGFGAMVEISAGDRRIVLGDGACLRYYRNVEEAPPRHQLLLELDDGSALSCSIQMYGTVLAFPEGECGNKYYHLARIKPPPLSGTFDRVYFESLCADGTDALPAKAFLATGQRIPGLGNGTLQDILFHTGIHPKRKMGTLSPGEKDGLFRSVKDTLAEMTKLGGRDTEKDLFGRPGGYRTILSKNTVGKPCPVCGTEIQKTAYLGGAVYWCPGCQPLSGGIG